jgi:phosphohistidine phosphatase
MILTIMRHGEAGSAVSDRQRELTATGISNVRAAATHLAQFCAERSLPAPGTVVCSTWKRTRQTAELVRQALSMGAVDTLDALLPGGTPFAVDTALPALWEESSHLLLVSHQPLVSRLVDYYCGVPGQAPGLPPGGYVTLKLEAPGPRCGRLLFWAFPPDYEAGV